jgi:Lipase (class 3)
MGDDNMSKRLNNSTATTNLLLRQKMLCFAYLAYSGEGITTPNPEPVIKGLINTGLTSIKSVVLNDWQIVWGPVTYTVPGSLYQDNLLYVVQQTGTSDYVIAIRGTNGINELDWLFEDFEVQNTIPWPLSGTQNIFQTGCAVTESTSIAMNILLNNMEDPISQLTLVEYLKTVTNSQTNVCVTGHSLGGALTPTLALWLLENSSEWDISASSTVSCISFAGPTAGNQLFAKYSMLMFEAAMLTTGSFPGWDKGLMSNCDTVVCDMDIAPFFYSYANIFNFITANAGPLFNVYPQINPSNMSYTGIEEWGYIQEYIIMPLAAALYSQNYTQLEAPQGSSQAVLSGVFNGDGPASDSFSDYLTAFYTQACWQHVYSYPLLLNVTELQSGTSIINEDLPPLTLASISPSYLDNNANEPAQPYNQTLVFTGTGFDQSATVDIYPAGVTGVSNIIINSISVNSSGTTLTANLTFPDSFFNQSGNVTYFSYYIFRVMNPDGSISNTTTFYYYDD